MQKLKQDFNYYIQLSTFTEINSEDYGTFLIQFAC